MKLNTKEKVCPTCGGENNLTGKFCSNSFHLPKQQSIEDVAYTEAQVRTAYKAGVLRGLEYKSRGKKKTTFVTPNEEQLIQTLKKKL